MNHIRHSVAAFASAAGLFNPTLQAAVHPYATADANTIYLYHLDETAGGSSAANSGSAGYAALTVDGNPLATGVATTVTSVLGSTGFSGFGNSANISANDLGLGVNPDGDAVFEAAGAAAPDNVTTGTFMGAGNAFTLEAMVKLPSLTAATNREIWCTDNNGTRGFQFRITAAGLIEFNFIGTAPAGFTVAIPTTGTEAFVANEWFHVALVHDESSGISNKVYWTRVDAAKTTAVLLAENTVETASTAIVAPLVLGNEGRNISSGVNMLEGFLGQLDEARISNVARTASQFIFFDPAIVDADLDGLSDLWEDQYFGDNNGTATTEELALQNGNGDFDNDGANNEAEESAGTNAASDTSWPDTDTDGLKDAWEVSNFGSITAQGAAGDPDGDLAGNLAEFTNSTDPKNAASWPDTDADSMNDAWETTFFGNLSKDGSADTDGDSFTDWDEHEAQTNPAAVTGSNLSPIWSTLKNRWSFNNDLTDSIGGSNATIVEVGANDVFQSATSILMSGGTKATSDYVQLGTNLLPNTTTPVTIELWTKQNTIRNWGRIFDFHTDTGEELFMSWSTGTNGASERVEWRDNAVVSGVWDSNQPYGTTDEHHIVMTLEPLKGSNGTTRVTWYSAPSGQADLGPAQGTFDTAINLVNFNDAINALGFSPWPDDTASATYNEVRIWNGALFSWMREKLHDQGPDNAAIPDSDNDRLPDAWEELFFPGNPAALTTSGDHDADGTNDRDEYIAGSNPDNNLSTPVDTDADGLADSWEISYFTNTAAQNGSGDPDGDLATNEEEEDVFFTNPTTPDNDVDGLHDGWERTYFPNVNHDTTSQDGTGDPDGDGYTNEQEETGNSNPTVLASIPYDTDGDGLLDTFEVFYFTTIATQNGTDDSDSDGAGNAAEQAAGSNPNLLASTPADTDGDGLVDTAETIKPYTVDSHTLHLWHLDEISAPSTDAGSAAISLTSLQNGALMWTPSVGGFGTGLNTAAAANSRLGALPEAADTADNTITTYAGAGGEFTLEAIVKIGFDPFTQAALTTMQILSAEGDTDANRQFQFRIRYNTANVPSLEYINLLGGVAPQIIGAAIPLSGDHAIAQSGWYHAAVSYDGAENTAGNIKLYWTKLDPSFTQANVITAGTENLAADMINPVEGSDLVIGNEGRSTGGTTDRFFGTIDEVRVSSVARAADGFHFTNSSNDLDGDGMDDTWETTYFGGTSQSGTGDFDGDGTANLTEFRLGLTPNSGSSLFAATRGAAGQLTWPSVAGVTFTVKRSTSLAAGSWTTIGTVPGTAGTASFTDPSPPAGSAFYQILLEP